MLNQMMPQFHPEIITRRVAPLVAPPSGESISNFVSYAEAPEGAGFIVEHLDSLFLVSAHHVIRATNNEKAVHNKPVALCDAKFKGGNILRWGHLGLESEIYSSEEEDLSIWEIDKGRFRLEALPLEFDASGLTYGMVAWAFGFPAPLRRENYFTCEGRLIPYPFPLTAYYTSTGPKSYMVGYANKGISGAPIYAWLIEKSMWCWVGIVTDYPSLANDPNFRTHDKKLYSPHPGLVGYIPSNFIFSKISESLGVV